MSCRGENPEGNALIPPAEVSALTLSYTCTEQTQTSRAKALKMELRFEPFTHVSG